VEPNSSLGEAISYLLKHWEKLTLFLRQPGAPLDNNICERALKKAILRNRPAKHVGVGARFWHGSGMGAARGFTKDYFAGELAAWAAFQ